MTIQPSLIVWTIICFIALYLILRNLLFKPVLETMDRRQQKIDEAQARREAKRKQNEETEALRIVQAEEAAKKLVEDKNDLIEAYRVKAKEDLESAKEARISNLETAREQIASAYEADMQAASTQVDDSVDLFLSRLFVN